MCEQGLMVSIVSLSCIIYSLLSAMQLSTHASKALDCFCKYGNLSSVGNADKGLIVFKKKLVLIFGSVILSHTSDTVFPGNIIFICLWKELIKMNSGYY